MRIARLMSAVLGTVAIALIVVASGFTAWVRWEASRAFEPDRRKAFYEPIPVAEPPIERRSLFATARVGNRFEIVDHAGRVVVFRGVVAGRGSGRPPFRPIAKDDLAAFRQLRAWGVNAISLSVPWRSIEKKPRDFDLDHLDYLRWFLEAAKRHDMAVIIDNSRDDMPRCFNSTGAPTWADRKLEADDNAVTGECTDTGFPSFGDLPGRLRWWADFWDGTWTPDDLALQDHAIWSFHKLAEVMQRHPALLGYGMLDEPPCLDRIPESLIYPGEFGCEQAMYAFYRRFAITVRNVDRDALFFFEPAVRPAHRNWDGRETGLTGAPMDGSVFAVRYHGVDSIMGGVGLDDFLDNTVRLATWGFGTPLILAEFDVPAGLPGTAADLAQAMGSIEDARVSSFVWNYSRTGGPSPGAGRSGTSLVVQAGRVGGVMEAGTPRCFAGAFVRPYPRRIAGIPISYGFDRSFNPDGEPAVTNTDIFTLVFEQGKVIADTLVYVPRTMVYGEDPATEAPEFIVEVSDGQWKWSPRDPNIMIWTTDPKTALHTLSIKPWGGRPAPGNGVGECVP